MSNTPVQFGSRWRHAREDGDYQSSRMQAFLTCLAQLADAHARHAEAVQHEANELWRGNRQLVGEHDARVTELNKALAWAEEQRAAWERAAQASEQEMRAKDAVVHELQEARTWLEQHAASWERAAEERQRELAKLQTDIQKVNEAKTWFEQQLAERDGSLEELRTWAARLEADNQKLTERIKTIYANVEQWQHQFSHRALRKLGIQRPLHLE